MNYDKDYLQNYLETHIPMFTLMAMEILKADQNSVEFKAASAPNLNDKGTIFAGSVYSVAVLAGWSYIFLRMRNNGIKQQLVIYTADIKYRRPLIGEFSVRTTPVVDEQWSGFKEDIDTKGKGSLTLQLEIVSGNGEIAAVFQGKYYAIPA